MCNGAQCKFGVQRLQRRRCPTFVRLLPCAQLAVSLWWCTYSTRRLQRPRDVDTLAQSQYSSVSLTEVCLGRVFNFSRTVQSALVNMHCTTPLYCSLLECTRMLKILWMLLYYTYRCVLQSHCRAKLGYVLFNPRVQKNHCNRRHQIYQYDCTDVPTCKSLCLS